MEERERRRKMVSGLLALNRNGYFVRNGVTFFAINYIRDRIMERLDEPEKLSKFLNKVKSSKIIVGSEDEKENAIVLLKNHGLNPTSNKFIIMTNDQY